MDVEVVDVEVVVVIVEVEVVLVEVVVVVVTFVVEVVANVVVVVLLVVVVGLHFGLLVSAGLSPTGHRPAPPASDSVQLPPGPPTEEHPSQHLPHLKGGKIPAPETADIWFPSGLYLHTRMSPAA